MTDPVDEAPAAAPSGIPLLITRRQRAELRDRGFTEGDIGVMTPARAHRLLSEEVSAPAASDSG